MIYYSSVLIALIKDCVNFVQVNMICCKFAAEPKCTIGTVPLGNTKDKKLQEVGSRDESPMASSCLWAFKEPAK